MAEEKEKSKINLAIKIFVIILMAFLIISIILPSYNSNCGTPFYMSCQANMRQLGLAVMMYAVDNKEMLPTNLPCLEKEYLDDFVRCTHCPGNWSDTTSGTDYVLCTSGSMNDYPYPVMNLLLWELPYNHFQTRANCCFVDDHVENFGENEFADFAGLVQKANNLLAKLRNNSVEK